MDQSIQMWSASTQTINFTNTGLHFLTNMHTDQLKAQAIDMSLFLCTAHNVCLVSHFHLTQAVLFNIIYSGAHHWVNIQESYYAQISSYATIFMLYQLKY